MELFKLFGTISLKDEASKGLDVVDGKAEKTGGLFGKLAKGVGVGAVAIGAAAAGAGAGMFAMAEKAAGTTDRIDKLSQKIGLSREGFQEWDFIMSQSGGSVEGLQMGFKTLVNSVDQAIDGTGKGAESFAALGVSVKDASGNVKDQETIFNESVIALQNMEDGTEKAKLANDLFGRSGAEMMPLLNGAAGSVEAMKEQAHELGLVMGDDAVDAGVVFTDTMDQLKRSFGTAAAEIGVQMMPLITKFADFIIGSMPTIQRVMGAVFDGISTAIGATMDFISNRVIPVFQSLWDFLEPRLPAIQAAFETAFGFVKTVIEEVVEVIKDLTAWFVEHWALVGPILAGIAAGAIAFQVITAAMKAYKAITTLVTLAQTKMNIAMLANPIGLIVVAIGLLVAAGILLYQNWDVVKEKLDLLWTGMKAIWGIIVQYIKDSIEKIKESVSTGFNNVKDFITNTWESIKTFFQVAWEFIKFIFTTVVTAIVDFVKQRFENLKNNISTVFNAIKNFISAVWDGIKSAVSAVVTGIVDFIKQRFENLKNNVSTVFNAIKNFITDTWNRIKSTISNLVEGIKNTVRDKFQAMKDAVTDKMNSAKDSIKGIWDSVMGFFKGINLFSMGKNIIQGLINGIKGMAGSLLSAVKRLVTDNIPGPIKKIMGIASPSKLMHQYGEWTGEGLEEGMEDSAGGIHRASVKLAHAAIPSINPMDIGAAAARTLVGGIVGQNNETPSLLAATLEQNRLLAEILKKDNGVYLDSDMISDALTPSISRNMGSSASLSMAIRGMG